MDWITTSTILEDLADYGNGAAWERFTGRFRPPIVRFARGLGLPESEAEDVAQETLVAFATTYREQRYDRSLGRLSRWLFGIAHRQALAARRKLARRAEHARATSFWADVAGDSCEALWDREWEQAVLEQCWQRVRQEVEPATIRAFERVMRHGRSPAEAAADLEVPVKAVYNAKHTVLKRMRELRKQFEEPL